MRMLQRVSTETSLVLGTEKSSPVASFPLGKYFACSVVNEQNIPPIFFLVFGKNCRYICIIHVEVSMLALNKVR